MCGDLGKAMRSRQMSFHVKWLKVDIFAYVSDYVGEFKKFIKNFQSHNDLFFNIFHLTNFYENAKRDKTFYEVVPVGASAIYSNDDDVDAI